jgi:glycosyltransferase involved in cell wall biosynthesis
MGSRLEDVTLYVPARNAEAWLAQCVHAAQRLDPGPAQILVVYDDNSRDQTAAIARGLDGVTAIAQPRPGLTAARNTALITAGTRWLAAIDSDVLEIGRASCRERVS